MKKSGKNVISNRETELYVNYYTIKKKEECQVKRVYLTFQNIRLKKPKTHKHTPKTKI